MPLWHLRFNIIAFYLEKKDKNQNQACRRIRERSLKPWPSYERLKMRWTNMGHHITSYTATVLPAQPPYWKILFKLAPFFSFLFCVRSVQRALSFAYITYCLVVCRWQNGQGWLVFSSPSAMSNVSPLQQRFDEKILPTNLSSILKLVLKHTFT